MNTTQIYNAQADSINVDDIATNENNRYVLDRIKRNSGDDNNSLYIQSRHDCDSDYVPEGAKDMGWLGYFIGKSNHLEKLYINYFDRSYDVDVIKPFFSGVSNNKSIRELEFYDMDLLGGKIFTMMDPFFKNNNSLEVLTVNGCTLDREKDWRLLALVLGSCNSLTELTIMNNNISDEGLIDIITALSMHHRLSKLDLDENCLNKNGCIALATLLKCSATRLQHLDLGSNELDDECIGVLVPALKNYSHLGVLRLSDNDSITSKGWQKLASILRAPDSNINDLILSTNNNIDDDALATFAMSLVNNIKLHSLNLNNNQVNAKGWDAFSKLLCDDSSVNSTFLSNHILDDWGVPTTNGGIPLRALQSVESLLKLNKRKNKKEVAMIKILQHHNEFDMMPFFEWEFKVLPLMIEWFERASTIVMPENFDPNIRPRKLSSIYQFVRSMPVLHVETRLRKELEDIKAAQIHIEEERARLDQQKQSNEERKRSILERLGHNV